MPAQIANKTFEDRQALILISPGSATIRLTTDLLLKSCADSFSVNYPT